MENLKRLNKFIGETGRCSRREADEIIEAGRVTVNGKPAELGMKVSPEDEIRIDGKLIAEKIGKPVYLALNKPPGIECTTNTEVRDNIIDFVNFPRRIFPIGRLDKASEGLIFLTDDGEIVNKILRARNNHEKEYEVTVNKPITDRFVQRMANGIPILDTVTRKCFVEQTGKDSFRIILTQGLNRQIRRMCEYLGYEVVKLRRVRIINIKLDIPVGRHRELTQDEIDQLQKLIEPSSKTEEASLPKQHSTDNQVNRELRKTDFQKKDFQRRDVRKVDAQPRDSKKDFQKKDFGAKPGKSDFSRKDAPKKDSGKQDFSRNDSKDAPKRKFEVIKKDDPRYRKEGEY